MPLGLSAPVPHTQAVRVCPRLLIVHSKHSWIVTPLRSTPNGLFLRWTDSSGLHRSSSHSSPLAHPRLHFCGWQHRPIVSQHPPWLLGYSLSYNLVHSDIGSGPRTASVAT